MPSSYSRHSSICVHQVFINKPLGIKFARGKDGMAYVSRTDPVGGNIDERVQARVQLHTF